MASQIPNVSLGILGLLCLVAMVKPVSYPNGWYGHGPGAHPFSGVSIIDMPNSKQLFPSNINLNCTAEYAS